MRKTVLKFPVLFLSCRIALVSISGIMPNRNGESGYPCLTLNLREKVFNVSPINVIPSANFFFFGLCQLEKFSLFFCFVFKEFP